MVGSAGPLVSVVGVDPHLFPATFRQLGFERFLVREFVHGEAEMTKLGAVAELGRKRRDLGTAHDEPAQVRELADLRWQLLDRRPLEVERL